MKINWKKGIFDFLLLAALALVDKIKRKVEDKQEENK